MIYAVANDALKSLHCLPIFYFSMLVCEVVQSGSSAIRIHQGRTNTGMPRSNGCAILLVPDTKYDDRHYIGQKDEFRVIEYLI